MRLTGISINSHDPESALGVVRERMVDALQVFYNIFDQSPEDELFPACLEHGVGVLARVPFDEGSLTGKLTVDTKFPDGDFRAQYFGGKLLAETVAPRRSAAPHRRRRRRRRWPAARCATASPTPAVSTVIPGMRTPHQVDENTRRQRRRPAPARRRRGAAPAPLGPQAVLRTDSQEIVRSGKIP